MSFKWTVPAFQCKVGNAIKKLILIKLADQANDDGECWPSQNTLANAAECSRRTVASHIKSLSESGYIKVKNRNRDDGSRASNMYLLTYTMDGKPLHTPYEAIPSHAPCANTAHHEPIINEPKENLKNYKKFSEDDFRIDVWNNKQPAEGSEYPVDMLKEFFRYWSEKNPRGKMKFQLKETWQTNLRLVTWGKNCKEYNKHQPEPECTIPMPRELTQRNIGYNADGTTCEVPPMPPDPRHQKGINDLFNGGM